jgi:hypothetical protein
LKLGPSLINERARLHKPAAQFVKSMSLQKPLIHGITIKPAHGNLSVNVAKKPFHHRFPSLNRRTSA